MRKKKRMGGFLADKVALAKGSKRVGGFCCGPSQKSRAPNPFRNS